jgi:hypothetical protein
MCHRDRCRRAACPAGRCFGQGVFPPMPCVGAFCAGRLLPWTTVPPLPLPPAPDPPPPDGGAGGGEETGVEDGVTVGVTGVEGTGVGDAALWVPD